MVPVLPLAHHLLETCKGDEDGAKDRSFVITNSAAMNSISCESVISYACISVRQVPSNGLASLGDVYL